MKLTRCDQQRLVVATIWGMEGEEMLESLFLANIAGSDDVKALSDILFGMWDRMMSELKEMSSEFSEAAPN